jgi:hypothetical protein
MKKIWRPILIPFAVLIAIVVLRDAVASLAAASVQEASHNTTQQGPSSIGTAGAVWEPPNPDFSEALPKATIPKEMLSKIVVSGMSVNLEKTAISDIAAHFGATIGGKGDAGDSVQWVCFRGVDAGGDWVLWLESGEINGGTVGSFRWQRVGNADVLDQRCRLLRGRAVELQNQLRLGLAQADVLKELGPATVSRADRAVYVHEHDESIHGEPYTSVNVVVVLFRQGKVQAIDVSKTTSS